MSTTNREKRKQAKRKARERRGRGRPKPSAAELLEAARNMPDGEAKEYLMGLVESGKVSRRALGRAFEREAAPQLAADRAPLYPGLADRLAADGWADTDEPVFLRFGELPEGERSTTEFPGIWEKGVSVFAGRMTAGGHYVIKAASWAQPIEFMRLCGEQNRDAYFVQGDRVGKGGSDEPVLRNIRSFEPVPADCVVALPAGSRSLDLWNTERIGAWLEDVPELARYFDRVDPDARELYGEWTEIPPAEVLERQKENVGVVLPEPDPDRLMPFARANT